MLRSIIKSKHLLTLPRRALSTVEPSTTTTVIIKSLSASATETSLKAALADVVTNTRKVEMEPGCSIHVINEAQASYVSSIMASKFSYDGSVTSTTLPSLLLQNLPSTVCSNRLEKAFGRFQPKMIRLVGSSSIKVPLKVLRLFVLLYCERITTPHTFLNFIIFKMYPLSDRSP